RVSTRSVDGVEHVVEVLRGEHAVVRRVSRAGVCRVRGEEVLETAHDARRARSARSRGERGKGNLLQLDGETLDRLLNLVGIGVLEAGSVDSALRLGHADVLAENHRDVELTSGGRGRVVRIVGTFDSAGRIDRSESI